MELHRPPDKFRKNAHLAASLFESTHVDYSRCQNLAGADADYSIDRQEHATTTGDFHGEPDDDRSAFCSVGHHNIAHATDPIAEWVKDRTSRESGDIDACRTHVSSVLAG